MSVSVTKNGRFKHFGDHNHFLQRIKKTLYYGSVCKVDCLSFPVTELAAELFSQPKYGHSLERLQFNEAAMISRNACVSPCSLVLAILYLERLKLVNPEYLQQALPSELFLVSLMISSKFLHDDGEDDQVFVKEWAASGKITPKRLIQLEKEFLDAIQWEIHISNFKFWEKLIQLEKIIAKKEGTNRGWFNYTELENLLNSINLNDLLQYISGLFVILAATYTIGFLIMVGAVHAATKISGNHLLLLSSDNDLEINTNEIPQKLLASNNTNTDFANDLNSSGNDIKYCRIVKKPLDAADVLKTSILLASIKSGTRNISENSPVMNFSEKNKNQHQSKSISWDWWNCFALTWLAETSKVMETITINFKCFILNQYQEKCLANCKVLDLEDQVHKATKIRIQDQIERSWHKEWTDMFKHLFLRKTTLHKLMM